MYTLVLDLQVSNDQPKAMAKVSEIPNAQKKARILDQSDKP